VVEKLFVKPFHRLHENCSLLVSSSANRDLNARCDHRLLVKGLIQMAESLSFSIKMVWMFEAILRSFND